MKTAFEKILTGVKVVNRFPLTFMALQPIEDLMVAGKLVGSLVKKDKKQDKKDSNEIEVSYEIKDA